MIYSGIACKYIFCLPLMEPADTVLSFAVRILLSLTYYCTVATKIECTSESHLILRYRALLRITIFAELDVVCRAHLKHIN